MEPTTREFHFQGHRLVFDEYGVGDRPVLLLPGLLFSRKMHRPLAEQLAERGHRVLCLDLLGHGDSDRPPEMFEYSMTIFGEQAIGLLDHLQIDQAVIGGTSLGANATLEAAAKAPDRVKGLLVELPVSLTFGAPFVRLGSRLAGRIPRGTSHLSDMVLDWASQDTKPSASVLQG